MGDKQTGATATGTPGSQPGATPAAGGATPAQGSDAWAQYAAYWAAYGYDVNDPQCSSFSQASINFVLLTNALFVTSSPSLASATIRSASWPIGRCGSGWRFCNSSSRQRDSCCCSLKSHILGRYCLCIPYITCIHTFLYKKYSSKEFIGMEKCAFPFLATYYEKVKGAEEAHQTMKPGGS